MHSFLSRQFLVLHRCLPLLNAAWLVLGLIVASGAHAAAPVISGSPAKTATVGVPYSFQPTASDADGNTLTFSIVNKPGWSSFNTATGRLSGTPTTPYTHSNIWMSVTDGTTRKWLPTFSITVSKSTIRPPTISGTPSASATVGTQYSFRPTASDPQGRSLTFSIANKPSWLSFSTTSGRISGTPTTAGVYSNIVLSVSNGVYSAAVPAFKITVGGGTNSPPAIAGTPPTTATVGIPYAFQPTASDANGNTLTFSIANKPYWATFSATTGSLSGTPATVVTHASIVISVSDGQASVSLPAYSIVVAAAPNAAPTISGTPQTSVVVGGTYTFQPAASDPNGDVLTFSIANTPNWATFSTSTGRLTGTPTAANVGTYSNITISVSDGKVTRSLPAFAVAVNAYANGSATLSWMPPTTNENGTTLIDLRGYRIYYGTSASALTQMVQVNGTSLTSYVVTNLSPATYYFSMTAFNSSNVESTRTTPVAKGVN